MANVYFNGDSFVASLEPGISALVVSAFKEALELKLNAIIEDVFAEMEERLPSEIKTTIDQVLCHYDNARHVNVSVSWDVKPTPKEKE